MKLINSTTPILYYYISTNKNPGILYFGQQVETLEPILSFVNIDEWKNHINNELATDTWFDDSLKQQIEEIDNSKKYTDQGYLTYYNFRLSMNDETEELLDSLIASDTDPVSIKAFSGDTYTISRADLIKLTKQYKTDKPLYLAMVGE